MAKDVKRLNFEYNDKKYCLEFSRATARLMESNGFNPNELSEKMQVRLPELWAGAFLMHHRATNPKVIEEIYGNITKKQELFEKLTEMYMATYESLLEEPEEDNPGNVIWTATF